MITKLWDTEVGTRIFGQANALFAETILGKDMPQFYEVLGDIMHKLTAMKYHLLQYQAAEQEFYEKHRKSFQEDPNSNEECFPLVFAFEAFLFQMKSCLDMLIKLFEYVPLRVTPKTATFTASGEKLIARLRDNHEEIRKLMERGQPCEGQDGLDKLENLIDLVQDAKDRWLERTVAVRDTVSHYKAASKFTFTPVKNAQGEIDAVRPTFIHNDRFIEPVPFMETVYGECLIFCQDFLTFVMCLRREAHAMYVAPMEKAQAIAFGGDERHAAFLRWGFQMVIQQPKP